MRKFLIYSVLSISLLACKKNDEKVAETEAKEDSIKVEPTKSDSNDSYYNYYHIDAGDLTLYQVIMMFNYGRRIFFSEQCRQKIQTDQQNQ